MRSFLIGIALLSLMCSPILAASSVADTKKPEAASNVSQAQEQAGAFIQNFGDEGVSIITNKGLTREEQTERYYDLLHKSIDLETIGRFVLGRAWNSATPEQREEFLKLFEALVFRNYSEKLNFYSGQNFRVKSVRPESEKDLIVNSEIIHPSGRKPTSIDWRVRNKGDHFAIVDMIVEGISQSISQRQEYNAILQRNGGQIDALLNMMRQRLDVTG